MRRCRAFLPTVLALVLAGCTPTSVPTVSTTPPVSVTAPVPARTVSTLPETASPTGTPPPEVDPTPVKCGLSAKQVHLLIRDWDRVVNSVGREDQAKYTGQFVTRMKAVSAAAAKCPGGSKLEQLKQLANLINASAEAGDEALDAINQFRQVGNEWLQDLGYEPLLLS